MEKIINEIFEELCALDPEFRAKEKETKDAILSIISARPETALDENFKIKLKNQLLEKNRELQNKPTLFNIFRFPNMNRLKIFYLSGSVVAVALLAIAAGLPYLKTGKTTITSNGIKISLVSDRAFGELSSVSVGGEITQESGQRAMTNANAADASSPAPAALNFAMSKTTATGESGVAISGSAITRPDIYPMPPIYTKYRYAYKGKLPEIANRLAVLKRIKGGSITKELSGIMDGQTLNLLDLGAFAGKSLQNITFTQAGDFGYQIYLNLEEGAASLSQNYSSWPRGRCFEDRCLQALSLKPEEIPTDEEIIKIADRFLAEHKINTAYYGRGEIGDNGYPRIMMPASGAAGAAETNAPSAVSAPDTAVKNAIYPYYYESTNVLYPLIVDGKTVYEQGGTPSGLYVSVDLKEKRVSSLNNLYTQEYAGSLYETETDADKLIAYAVKNNYGWYEDYPPAKTVEIELLEPKIGYVKYWKYDGQGAGEELLVPALIFPIKDGGAAADYYYYNYRKNVIVPIIKDILSVENNYPVPAPMMKSGGSAGEDLRG